MSERIFNTREKLHNEIAKRIKIAHKETLNILIDKLHEIETENVYNKPALFYSDNDSHSALKFLYYGFGSGLGEYNRTYDLYNVIRVYKIGSNQYQSIGEIKPIEGSLTHDWSMFQHDSPIRNSYPLDEETYLNIIEEGLSSMHSAFGTIIARPFWDEFLDYCDRNYEIIFEEEFEKL